MRKRRPPTSVRLPPIRGETVPYADSPYRGRPPLITPALVVDGVVLNGDAVLLVKRGRPPFRGRWALPGGFVELGETCESAVRREVREETGVRARVQRLVGVYSAPRRDPRAHLVSIAYRLAARQSAARGGDDAARAEWFSLRRLPRMAGDHPRILRDALRSRAVGPPPSRRRDRARR